MSFLNIDCFQFVSDPQYRLSGILLIAQLSTKGTLTDDNYASSKREREREREKRKRGERKRE